MDIMNRSSLRIGANMALHIEEILVTFLGLMHLGFALSFFFVEVGGGGKNNGRVYNGALAQR